MKIRRATRPHRPASTDEAPGGRTCVLNLVPGYQYPQLRVLQLYRYIHHRACIQVVQNLEERYDVSFNSTARKYSYGIQYSRKHSYGIQYSIHQRACTQGVQNLEDFLTHIRRHPPEDFLTHIRRYPPTSRWYSVHLLSTHPTVCPLSTHPTVCPSIYANGQIIGTRKPKSDEPHDHADQHLRVPNYEYLYLFWCRSLTCIRQIRKYQRDPEWRIALSIDTSFYLSTKKISSISYLSQYKNKIKNPEPPQIPYIFVWILLCIFFLKSAPHHSQYHPNYEYLYLFWCWSLTYTRYMVDS